MLEHDRPATRRGGEAHRPLPLVPRLHDHLPLGRALHAPGRPRPRPHREDLPAAAAGSALRAGCWRRCCPIRRLFRAAARSWRPAGAGLRGRCCRRARLARALAAMLRALARVSLPPALGRTRKVLSGAGHAASAGRACSPAARSRCSRRDQRGDDPAAHPPRRRGGDARRRGLLRRARPSHGPRRAALGAVRARTSTPGRARSRRGLDAIVITTSGCGTTVKDYGFMLRADPAYRRRPRASRRSRRM